MALQAIHKQTLRCITMWNNSTSHCIVTPEPWFDCLVVMSLMNHTPTCRVTVTDAHQAVAQILHGHNDNTSNLQTACTETRGDMSVTYRGSSSGSQPSSSL